MTMAAITAEDRVNLKKLSVVAPELAELAAKMLEKKGQNPALDRAGDAFSAQASDFGNIGKLMQLDKQFKANPELAKRMERLLETNP